MAIDVQWSTGIINVPKSSTTLIQASPEVRGLDVDAFRHELKDLEASTEGQPWPDTHVHRGEVTISGFVYARSVQILPPYRVEFEDGQYAVVLTGANNNIVDVRVENSVSIVSQNSAGLLVLDAKRGIVS